MNELEARDRAHSYGAESEPPLDDGPLLDWMSDEGLLEWVTSEVNCD